MLFHFLSMLLKIYCLLLPYSWNGTILLGESPCYLFTSYKTANWGLNIIGYFSFNAHTRFLSLSIFTLSECRLMIGCSLLFYTHSPHLFFILICREAKYSPMLPWTIPKKHKNDLDKSLCLHSTNWSVHFLQLFYLPKLKRKRSSAFYKFNCKNTWTFLTASVKKGTAKPPKHINFPSLSISWWSKQAKMKPFLNFKAFFFHSWITDKCIHSKLEGWKTAG